MKKTKSKKTQGKRAHAMVPEVVNNELKAEHNHMVKNGLSEVILGLGWGTPGMGTQLSQVDTLFQNNRWYLVSNMRQLLSEIYVEHGLVQTVVDVPVDDGLRGGVDIATKQLDEEQIDDLLNQMERENDLGILGQALKWNRLFGGGGVLIVTNQDPSTPLEIDSIDEGTPLKFVAVDMWELFWSKQNTSDYAASIDTDELNGVEYYDYYGIQVHHTRVIRMTGLIAPSFVRPRLRGWGFSIVEALVRSINQYLKSNNLSFEVLDEFKVDVFRIKGLANSLQSAAGEAQIRKRVQLANQEKNFQNALTMDSEDEWDHKQLSFAGISETMAGIRMQIASDLRMPMAKVFGTGAQGFSSGQDDIENYNAMVESQVRQKAKFDILRMVEIRCRKIFGFVPDDLKISFKPLRVLSAEQEENVKNSVFNRLLAAKQAGEISSEEFKEGCNRDELLPIQLNPKAEALAVGEEEGNEVKAVKGKGEKSSLEAPAAKNSYSPRAARDLKLPMKVACVGLTSKGEILTGKRREDGKWTNPGGHMEGVEEPVHTAVRELYEETGIKLAPEQLTALSPKLVKRPEGDVMVYPFTCEIDKEMALTICDPDSEILQWRWVPLDRKTPELEPWSRHSKEDVVLEQLLKGKRHNETIANPGKVDEAKWEKAKAACRKEYGSVKWPVVTAIYKKMGGTFQ